MSLYYTQIEYTKNREVYLVIRVISTPLNLHTVFVTEVFPQMFLIGGKTGKFCV